MLPSERRAEIAALLEELTAAAGGILTPEAVVDAARDPASVLHAQFEWDDSKAAAQYRIDQARALIRSVRVEIVVEERTVRAPVYLRSPEVPADTQGYAPMARLVTQRGMARAAMAREVKMAHAALKRARDVAAALGLAHETELALRAVGALDERVASLDQVASA